MEAVDIYNIKDGDFLFLLLRVSRYHAINLTQYIYIE